MKNNILKLYFFVLIITNSYAQKLECGWYGKKSVTERDKMFPFNEAKKVLLISFIPTDGTTVIVLDDGTKIPLDTTKIEKYQVKYLKSFTFKEKKVFKKYFAKEVIEIDKTQIDELSNLMFNYKIKKLPKKLINTPLGCYIPRNAVLFLDQNDKVISHLEICFECMQTYFSPDPYNTNDIVIQDNCFEKIELLRKFFNNNGIKYGVEKL